MMEVLREERKEVIMKIHSEVEKSSGVVGSEEESESVGSGKVGENRGRTAGSSGNVSVDAGAGDAGMRQEWSVPVLLGGMALGVEHQGTRGVMG